MQIVTVHHANGPDTYIVQIPGTQDWGPSRGGNPVDLTTNVALEGQAGPTRMELAVRRAMEAAHVPSGADIMLTGHSQGGITAAALASDGTLANYHVRSVVTAGSPIGRYQIPSGVSVLSLENDQDIVPKLDGVENPDQPNWITVHRDLTQGGASAPAHDPGAAHDQRNYAQDGKSIDQSDDATIRSWQEQNKDFMSSHTDAQRYQLVAAK